MHEAAGCTVPAGRGDWELIRRACVWIDHAAIPWRVPSGNLQSWLLMRLRSLAGERPAQTDRSRRVRRAAPAGRWHRAGH